MSVRLCETCVRVRRDAGDWGYILHTGPCSRRTGPGRRHVQAPIGPYNMHFTGYQPDNTRNKEFCEDIPSTGRTA